MVEAVQTTEFEFLFSEDGLSESQRDAFTVAFKQLIADNQELYATLERKTSQDQRSQDLAARLENLSLDENAA